LDHVLVAPFHPLADLWNIGKDGLLVPFAETLWGWDLVALRAARENVGVVILEDAEEAL
jgi:hypothetical protein